MKPEELTLVIPYYYDDKEVIDRMVEAWKDYPNGIKIIIIDDCSPVPLKIEHKNLTIYRIDKDIVWNTAGACNLGFLMATTPYVLYYMNDHVLSGREMSKLLDIDVKDKLYTFKRIEAVSGKDSTGALLPLFIKRELFWKLGGFNEDFSGNYGYDDVWFTHKAKELGYEKEELDITWNNYIDTEDAPREGQQINADKFKNKVATKDFSNNILNFSFTKTYES